jgi:hypothetical protein
LRITLLLSALLVTFENNVEKYYADPDQNPADASTEQLQIIIGALYLSLAQAAEHIAATER